MEGFFASSEIQQSAPGTTVPKCGACGLYKGCKSPKMEPYGKGRRDVLIVGESPSEIDDEQDRPLVGKVGQYLRSVLDGLRVDMDRDCVTTSALICRPPGNKIENDKMIDYCRPNLIRTLAEVRPRVVITLGHTALKSVLDGIWASDVGPLARWTGWQIPYHKFWICPTYHPSYLLRANMQQLDVAFENDLREAFDIDDDPPALWQPKVLPVYNWREVEQVLEDFAQNDEPVAFDYETNCLKPEKAGAKIYSCAVSNGKTTIAYPWTLDTQAVTVERFILSSLPKIASNMKFEDRWTRHIVSPGGVQNWWWDTMQAAHCMDNRPGITSLKFQMLVQMGVPSYNVNIDTYLEEFKDGFNRIEEISTADLLQYNGLDAVFEHALAVQQRKKFGYAKED